MNDRIGDFEAIACKQPNSLFLNDGRGRFRDATADSGLAAAVAAHRGCGVADFNGDGRLDVVVLVARRAGRAVAERERSATATG